MGFTGDNHANGDNLDYALQLEIWKGNVAGALRMAAEREQLTDWLVSLAAAGKLERIQDFKEIF